MEYCGKIRYDIFSVGLSDFDSMVDELLRKIPDDEALLRLVFFGMPPSNEKYLERYSILKRKVKEKVGNKMPALSYVSQPSLDSGLVLEVHSYRKDRSDELEYREYASFPYVILRNASGRFLFAGGFQSDIENLSIKEQSERVFHFIHELLTMEKFPVNSIVRQWNYIERITDFQDGYQNYQAFNDARGKFYAKATWENGYPAATGIGATHGGVLVDLDAVVFTDTSCRATSLDNKLQIAAHAYSKKMLVSGQENKSTPKFERAKSLGFGAKGVVYISGTAAIRGEESLFNVGLEKQLRITMENIDYLVSSQNLDSFGVPNTKTPEPTMLRVYLKEPDFVDEAKKLMETYELSIPVSYLFADVCRNELLIEIEGVAVY